MASNEENDEKESDKKEKNNNKHYSHFQFYFFNQMKFDAKISCKTMWSYFSYPEQVKQMKTRN